jgi:hypothetical protein
MRQQQQSVTLPAALEELWPACVLPMHLAYAMRCMLEGNGLCGHK